MALTKIPARDFKIEIDANYGASGGADFIPIGGLTSLTLAPKTTEADTTDFDSEGVAEHFIMERGLEFTISGQRLEDSVTGDRDPGQVAVEALGALVGVASLGSFQVTSPGGNVDSFLASAETTPYGGGHNDPANWNAKIHISGPVAHA